MTLNYPELFIPSLISFLVVLYVVPWHLQIRNIATLSMSFWMLMLNAVHIINPLIWNSSNERKATVYGDICCAIIVGYNFGLPLSHLLLARQLEALTSLRTRSVLYDVSLKRRNKIIDLGLCFLAPILGVLVHLTQMDRRYWIAQGFGPVPSTYWDAWGVTWMAIVPIGIAVGALVYTVMALVNIYLRRANMLSMVSSDNQTSKEQFIRLYCLSIAELGTCLLRAFFNMKSYQARPQPFNRQNREDKHIDLKTIGHIPTEMITGKTLRTMYLQWYTVAACSIVFFFCFATGTETTRFYKRVLSKFLPFIGDPDRVDMSHLTSKATGSSGSGKPSQYSSHGTCSSGREQKSEYDGTYQLDYINSPTTPTPARYKDSPLSPTSTYKDRPDIRGRLDSESEPFNQLITVASRTETTGAESAAESKLDDIEAQKYWDDILGARARTVRIDSIGVDEDGTAVETRKKDSYYSSPLAMTEP